MTSSTESLFYSITIVLIIIIIFAIIRIRRRSVSSIRSDLLQAREIKPPSINYNTNVRDSEEQMRRIGEQFRNIDTQLRFAALERDKLRQVLASLDDTMDRMESAVLQFSCLIGITFIILKNSLSLGEGPTAWVVLSAYATVSLVFSFLLLDEMQIPQPRNVRLTAMASSLVAYFLSSSVLKDIPPDISKTLLGLLPTVLNQDSGLVDVLPVYLRDPALMALVSLGTSEVGIRFAQHRKSSRVQ